LSAGALPAGAGQAGENAALTGDVTIPAAKLQTKKVPFCEANPTVGRRWIFQFQPSRGWWGSRL